MKGWSLLDAHLPNFVLSFRTLPTGGLGMIRRDQEAAVPHGYDKLGPHTRLRRVKIVSVSCYFPGDPPQQYLFTHGTKLKSILA